MWTKTGQRWGHYSEPGMLTRTQGQGLGLQGQDQGLKVQGQGQDLQGQGQDQGPDQGLIITRTNSILNT